MIPFMLQGNGNPADADFAVSLRMKMDKSFSDASSETIARFATKVAENTSISATIKPLNNGQNLIVVPHIDGVPNYSSQLSHAAKMLIASTEFEAIDEAANLLAQWLTNGVNDQSGWIAIKAD